MFLLQVSYKCYLNVSLSYSNCVYDAVINTYVDLLAPISIL